jgi:hypothetical protein
MGVLPLLDGSEFTDQSESARRRATTISPVGGFRAGSKDKRGAEAVCKIRTDD